jgi:hypothetical protein
MKRTQDGSNPLEEEGEPLQDGMVMKPEDVQQTEPDGFIRGTNIVPQEKEPIEEDEIGTGLTGGDMNDPTLSGIDEEEVDPNLLHQDPETGKNYTDLTDEQGNEVPDLRFDQNPDSTDQQPEVELEFEIVTKEEYESHLDTAMTQDEFDAELQNPTGEPVEEPVNPFEEESNENPFDDKTEDIPKENPFEDTSKEDKPKKETPKDDEEPKKKSSIKDIINREKELIESGVEDEELLDLLEEEFGEERMDKAQETKSWRNRK